MLLLLLVSEQVYAFRARAIKDNWTLNLLESDATHLERDSPFDCMHERERGKRGQSIVYLYVRISQKCRFRNVIILVRMAMGRGVKSPLITCCSLGVSVCLVIICLIGIYKLAELFDRILLTFSLRNKFTYYTYHKKLASRGYN